MGDTRARSGYKYGGYMRRNVKGMRALHTYLKLWKMFCNSQERNDIDANGVRTAAEIWGSMEYDVGEIFASNEKDFF